MAETFPEDDKVLLAGYTETAFSRQRHMAGVWEVSPHGQHHDDRQLCQLAAHDLGLVKHGFGGMVDPNLGKVSFIAWSPDGSTIAATQQENLGSSVSLYPVSSRGEHRRSITHSGIMMPRGACTATAVAFSSDSQSLAIATSEGVVVLHSIKSKFLKTLSGHKCEVLCLAWSPIHQMLASGSADGVIKLWDTQTHQEVFSVQAHTEMEVTSIHFKFDGHSMASGGGDCAVKLWTFDAVAVKLQPPAKVNGHDGSVNRDCVCPSRHFRAPLCKGIGHQLTVTCVAFSPCGTWLASGSEDKSIIIWDPVTMDTIGTLRKHEEPVTSLSWHPNCALLASVSKGHNVVHIWDLDKGHGLLAVTGDLKGLATCPEGHPLEVGVYVWESVENEECGECSEEIDPKTPFCACNRPECHGYVICNTPECNWSRSMHWKSLHCGGGVSNAAWYPNPENAIWTRVVLDACLGALDGESSLKFLGAGALMKGDSDKVLQAWRESGAEEREQIVVLAMSMGRVEHLRSLLDHPSVSVEELVGMAEQMVRAFTLESSFGQFSPCLITSVEGNKLLSDLVESGLVGAKYLCQCLDTARIIEDAMHQSVHSVNLNAFVPRDPRSDKWKAYAAARRSRILTLVTFSRGVKDLQRDLAAYIRSFCSLSASRANMLMHKLRKDDGKMFQHVRSTCSKGLSSHFAFEHNLPQVVFQTSMTKASPWFPFNGGKVAYSKDMHVAQINLGSTVLQAPGLSRPGNRPLAVHRAVKNILVTFHLTEEKNRLREELLRLRAKSSLSFDDFNDLSHVEKKMEHMEGRFGFTSLANEADWFNTQLVVRIMAVQIIEHFWLNWHNGGKAKRCTFQYCETVAQDQVEPALLFTKEVTGVLNESTEVQISADGCDGQEQNDVKNDQSSKDKPLGPWCLQLCTSAVTDLRNLGTKSHNSLDACLQKLREIEKGLWMGNVAKQLKVSRSSVPIYESKVLNNHRILWQVEAGYCPLTERDGQVIRVWTILSNHKEVTMLAPKIAAYNRSRPVDAQRTAKARYRPDPSNWKHVLPEQYATAQALVQPEDVAEEEEWQEEEQEEDAVEGAVDAGAAWEDTDYAAKYRKLYLLSQRMVDELVQGRVYDAQHSVSKVEAEVIKSDKSSMVIGRSGTGKTTCVLYRLLSMFQSYVREDGHGVKQFRQVFITKNVELCLRVEKHFKTLVQKTQSDSQGEDMEEDEEELLLVDAAMQEKFFRNVPESFEDIQQNFFPMFLTFEKLLNMLEATCRDRQKRVQAKNQANRDGDRESLQASYVESGRSRASMSGSKPEIALVLKDPLFEEKEEEEELVPLETVGSEVDFDVFCDKYWNRLNKTLSAHFDPSLVWAEIQSVLKGHEDAMCTPKGYLSLEQYKQLTPKHPSFLEHRDRLYGLFLNYEDLKKKNQDRDQMDRVHTLRTALSSLNLQDIGLESMDELYVDECQDLPPGVLHMLLGLLKKPDGFVMFCGDSAQTISKGSSFRFDDLSALYFRHMAEIRADSAKQTLVKQKLTRNFRSHNGILRLASSVIDLIETYFEDSIDKMERDYSEEEGALPSVVTGAAQEGWTMLFKTGTSKMEFGAHHAIIVRNEKAKNQVRNMSNRPGFYGTVFDAKGLEFSEVILYNFFTDSPAKNEWRIILQQLSNKGVPVLGGIPTMNPAKHNILVLELKELYTAITRPMHKLWIVDEMVQSMDERDLHPMFQYWMHGGCDPDGGPLLACVDQEDVLELFSSHSNHSTPEEWAKTGHYLFQSKHYENALHCFQAAGDDYIDQQRFVQACLVRSKAEKLSKKSGEVSKARSLFKEAGRLFEEINELVSAAYCYSEAVQYSKAGELYHQSAQRSDDKTSARKLFESAAAAYLKARQYLKACSVLEEAEMYEQALKVLKDASLFADAVAFAGKHKEKLRPQNLRLLAERALLYHHGKRQEEGMQGALGLLDSDEAREALLMKHRNHLGHRPLVKLYKSWVPPRLTDAGDVLDGEGEWIEALDLYILSGDPSSAVKASRSCVRLVSLHARLQPGLRLAVDFDEGMKAADAARLLDEVLALHGLTTEDKNKCLLLSHMVKGEVDRLESCRSFFADQVTSQMQRARPEQYAEACAWELRCMGSLLISSAIDSMKPREWASVFLRHVTRCAYMFPVELKHRDADPKKIMACQKYFSCASLSEEGASVWQDLWGAFVVKDSVLHTLFRTRLEKRTENEDSANGEYLAVVGPDIALRRMRRSLMDVAHAPMQLMSDQRHKELGQMAMGMMPCFSLAFYGTCPVGAKCRWSHKGSHADELDAYISVVSDMAYGLERLRILSSFTDKTEDKAGGTALHILLRRRRFWLERLIEVLQPADIRMKRQKLLHEHVVALPVDIRLALFNIGSKEVWLAKWHTKLEPRFDTGTLLHSMVLMIKLIQPGPTGQLLCRLSRELPNLKDEGVFKRLAKQELLRVSLALHCMNTVFGIEQGQAFMVLANLQEFARVSVENIDTLHINPMDLIELLEWGVTVALGCSNMCHDIVTPLSYLSLLVSRRHLVKDMMVGFWAHQNARNTLNVLVDCCFRLLSGLVHGRVFTSMLTDNDKSHVFTFTQPSFEEYRSMCTRLAILTLFASFNMDSSKQAMTILHQRILSFADIKRGADGLEDWPSKRDRETWLGQDPDAMLEGIRTYLAAGTNQVFRWTRTGKGFERQREGWFEGCPVAFFPFNSGNVGAVLFGEGAEKALLHAAASGRGEGVEVAGQGKSKASEVDFDQILQRDTDAANRIQDFFRGMMRTLLLRQERFSKLKPIDQLIEKHKEQAEVQISDWIAGQDTLEGKKRVWKYAALYRAAEASKTCVGLSILIKRLANVIRSLEGSQDEESLERMDLLAEVVKTAKALKADISIPLDSTSHEEWGFDCVWLQKTLKEAEVTLKDGNLHAYF